MIKINKFTWAALGAALLAAGLTMPTAHAQSADALLDKLVDKGVLTVKEANELREQSDQGFNKAYQSKSGMPDWISQLRIYGDVRGRAELFRFKNDVDGAGEMNKDRTRYRFRLRTGVTVQMKEDFEVGFRLTSSEANGAFGGDPISGNSTMQDGGSKKFLYIDTAYGKWTPLHYRGWTLGTTIGKMDNPFVFSDMVFDGDYTPEGAALQGGYAINDMHALKWNGGVFILDEINQGAQASDDPYMYGVQLRYDAKWTPELSSSVGLAWLTLENKQNLGNGAVPNVNVGNTRYTAAVGSHAVGDLVANFAPVVLDAAVTYNLDRFPLYPGPFPIKVAGEFMHNTGADSMNDGWWGGIFLGKSGKKGAWEVSYRYKYLEADAWYEELVDSDYGAYYQVAPPGSAQGAGYRAGTGVEGHVMKAVYSLSDSFTIGITYFLSELIEPPKVADQRTESTTHRVQIDAIWKF